MKKILLSVMTLLGVSLGAAAADDTYSGSMLYGHCTTASMPLNFPQAVTAGEAMQLPASVISQLAGCRITAIAVANGVAAKGSDVTSLPITLFMADELGATLNPTLSYEGTMPLSPSLEYTEYPLPEPITITTDMKPVYFGFYGESDPAKGTPLIVDARSNDYAGEGDWFAILENGKWDWQQLRNYYGFGCIRIKIEGSRLPGNEVSVIESHIPDFMVPGQKGRVEMYLQNEAGNVINSVDVTYTIGSGAEQTATVTLPRPLLYNDMTPDPVGFEFTAPDAEGGNIELSFRVSGVNGNASNQAQAAQCSGSGYFVSLAPGNGFKKNMVAEIATGTWCGYCPIGFVGVSKMLAAHSDGSFIPVAVHIGDEMAEQSYAMLATQYTGEGSAPMMVVNRNVGSYGVQNPSFDIMNGIYNVVTATPAVALPAIEGVQFDAAKKLLTVNASARFALNETAANYALAYVITEDNVGPYTQNNYYSAEVEDFPATLEGWTELPAQVDTLFGSVARMIRRFNGVSRSIPETIEAGTTYTHSEQLQTNSVSDINNCTVIVFVVNRTTGRIENAVSAPYGSLASIRDVEAAPAGTGTGAIYDLQGRRVAAPSTHGIYIVNGRKVAL